MKRTFAIIIFIGIIASASISGAQQRAPYIDGEVIVKYKSHVPDADRLAYIKKAGGIKARSLGPMRPHRVMLEKGLSVDSAIARFKADPNVQYAEPNYRIRASAIPTDTDFALQWGLNNTGQTIGILTGAADSDIDAPEAWDIRTDASGIIVAVIDSGVQYLHPDLTPNIWTNSLETDGNLTDDDGNGYIDDTWGWDFTNNDNIPEDDFGHGTHIAGIVGAVGNNGVGVSGVAWGVKLMTLKVMDSTGSGAISDTVEAIYYAVANGAKVINASYSYPDSCVPVAYSQAERDAIEYARQAGVLFVAAASNYSCNNDIALAYPASYNLDNVVSVAATNMSDGLAWFSDYGPGTVHLGAPGVEVLSTFYGSDYAYESGTSASAPFTCGVLSLIEAGGTTNYKEAREILLLSADPLASLSGYTITGGRINAYNALTFTLGASVPAPPSHLTISSDSATLSWVDNSTIETSYTIEMKDPLVGSYAWLAALGPDANSYAIQLPMTQSEGQPYYFRVMASNANGNSAYSSEVSTNAPPSAPYALAASALSDSIIALSWFDNSQIENGFIVEISLDGATFTATANLAANTSYAEITGLAPSTTYYFRVAAFSNTYGTSEYSGTVWATTLSTDTGGGDGDGDGGGGDGDGGDGSGGGNGSGGCFIATAAHGSAHSPDVETLRVFRDRILLASPAGREFVRLYYEYSPSMAARIEGRPVLMFAVRMALKPLVLSVRYPVPALALVLCAPIGLALMRRRRGMPDRKGFTLLELIVVVFILSILAAIVAPKFMGRTDDAKVAEAKVQIRNLETALKLYRIDTGTYPSTEQGLEALVTKPETGVIPSKYREGGYLEQVRVPADPWGNPYIYASPGTSGDFDIISLGADAKEGGEGLYDKDIKSWDMN